MDSGSGGCKQGGVQLRIQALDHQYATSVATTASLLELVLSGAANLG